MNGWLHRNHKRGQSIVIVALSATALFGIIALGMDAGRLYFQRRDVQNAADAGALGGAEDLLPPDGNPGQTAAMQQTANCDAASYALQNLKLSPQDASCGAGAYAPTANGYIVEPSSDHSATVTVWTPSRGNPNEIHVRVTYNVPLTFAAVIGFTTSAVVADAFAHGRFLNNLYAVFGFQAGPGGGNTVQYEQDGNAQIDDGNSGSDMCQPSNQGRVVSNSKWHAPNPNRGYLNVNGTFQHLSAADTHAIRTYWVNPVNPVPIQEPAPNYEATVNPGLHPNPTTGTINGKFAVYIYPGLYTSNLAIPGFGGGNANSIYIFENGLYLFQNANLTITGGIVANTTDGLPKTKLVGPGSFVGGYSDLPANVTDGTNGVEFIFDGSGSFSATSPSGTAPSVFFASPTAGHTPSGVTDSIAFFVRQTDTNSSPWTEQIDGTKATAGGYPFQVWGTVFVNEANATATLQAASAWVSAANPGTYAVTGELAAPRVDLWGGNLAPGPFTASNPGPPCSASGYVQNNAGLLVQFNQNYAPHFQGYAYLVR
jgi:Flp pilus assembly protein TadG